MAKNPTIEVESGKQRTFAINLELIARGLTQFAADRGLTDIQCTVTRPGRHSGYTLDYTWKRNGVVQQDQLSANNPNQYKTVNIYYIEEDSLADYFMYATSNLKGIGPIFVQLLNGNYKGSIAEYDNWLSLGKDPISSEEIRISKLSARNMKVVEATTTELVYVKKETKSQDSFGNTNEIDDIIVYIDMGKISYGVFVAIDTRNDLIVLKAINGYSNLDRVYLKPGRDMMNITKMPSNKAAQNILKAQLTAGT